MRIYICIPDDSLKSNFTDIDKNQLQKDFVASLRKYYGSFRSIQVEFYRSDDRKVTVYVMGKALCTQDDTAIKDVIDKHIKRHFTSVEIDIRLNYQVFKKDFRPPADAKLEQKHQITQKPSQKDKNNLEEFDYEKLSFNYHADSPHFTFEQVILPPSTVNQILEAVGTIQVEGKVFDDWGLRNIIPYATSAMSFYGPPGTGKTMAAEAVAQHLGKKIIRATYADIESKFHGEGPKMVKAIFKAAERENAVLFLDESDSLLSKRLTNVTDGSAQAINSMRSQLLICLEQFKGIVIFATNLVINYDKAFLSRLISIEFPMPDATARDIIWQRHIRGKGINIPLSEDVNTRELAERFPFCGREIKNAVKDACVTVAMKNADVVTQADFLRSCEKTKTESDKVINATDHTQSKTALSPKQGEVLKTEFQKRIDEKIKSNN